MRRFAAAMQPDALSDLLRAARFRSIILCRSELRAPWGFSVTGRDFATFHIVLRGRGYLDVDTVPEQKPLRAGDLVVLPHGNAHAVRDAPGSRVTRLEDLIQHAPTDDRGILRGGGRGRPTTLVCGGFRFEERVGNPLLAALPSVIHLRGRSPGVNTWLRTMFGFLTRESLAPQPGGDSVIARLADILFIEAIRAYFASPEAKENGFAVALRDPRIGAALSGIHGRPEADWTIQTLARRAGMSRTAFALQFARLVGEPPLRYILRHRMNRAAELLRETTQSIAEVAERAGYNSESSFSRAFRRVFGTWPAAYRRRS